MKKSRPNHAVLSIVDRGEQPIVVFAVPVRAHVTERAAERGA
jgi:hypothetical protein